MKLKVDWNQFKESISDHIEKGREIAETAQDVNTENEFNQFKQDFISWRDSVLKYIDQSFDEKNSEMLRDFRAAKHQQFQLGGNLTYSERTKNLATDVRLKCDQLQYSLKVLSVSDQIINGDDGGEKYMRRTEDILDLILQKLYILFGDDYFPVKSILLGNGIEMTKSDEDRDYTDLLKDKGFIECQYSNQVYARLTTRGKIYVEVLQEKANTNYENIPDDQGQVDAKIDRVIRKLEELGYGQEVLFNEIEEMKDLYTKLDKRNWGKLLKGKVIDLVLDQIINKDTAMLVLDSIIDGASKFIKPGAA